MKDIIAYLRLLRNIRFLLQSDFENTIIIRAERYFELCDSGELIVDTIEDKANISSSAISSDLMKYLINNEKAYLDGLFNDNSRSNIEIAPITQNGSYDTIMIYSKASFIRKAEEAYKHNLITEEEYQKVLPYIEKISYDKLQEEYAEQELSIKIDNENYSLPIQTFFDILSLSQKELVEILKQDTIMGIPTDHFVTNMNSFLSMSEILKRYSLPEEMLINISYIYQNVDTMVADKTFKELPEYTKQIEVNPKLWDKIISLIPEDFNKLEKAYYIYYLLCQTFTYDEEYLLTRGEGPNARRHLNISYLKELDEDNNELVCFEFNAIYSKFLEYLGAKIEYIGNDDYQSGKHASLKFALGKYLINADAVKGILTGDLPRSKMNRPLTGFAIENFSKDSIQEFANSLVKVNRYIRKQAEQEQSYLDTVSRYKNLSTEKAALSPVERKNILLTGISTCNLPPVDSLLYVQTLTGRLFSTKENQCQSYFIKDNFPPETSKKQTAIAIVVCFNESSNIEKDLDNNEYYLYRPQEGITKLSREDLSNRFKTSKFNKIPSYEIEIPGIKTK